MNYNNSSLPRNFSCEGNSLPGVNYVLAGLYCLLIPTCLLGNALVISVVLKVITSRGLLTNVYIYIISLSVADFGESILTI